MKYQQQKSKTTGILLAVFLGLVTWIYTYKYDAWKLWANIILIIATFGLFGPITWVWAVIDTVIKPQKAYECYY